MSNKIKRKNIRYYLYNYSDLSKMIKERELDYISYLPISYNRFARGFSSYNIPTIENQALMIMQDKKLEEMKLYKKEFDRLVPLFKKVMPTLYSYMCMKYFCNYKDEEIKEKIRLEDLRSIDNEVMKYFETNIRYIL